MRLESGAELDADIVVTATGLQLLALGGVELDRRRRAGPAARDDGLQGHDAQRRAELRVHHRLHERVLDAEGRPGQRVRLPAARSTWTRRGYDTCVPVNDDPGVEPAAAAGLRRPATSQRSIDLFPQAGLARAVAAGMSYAHDVVTLRHGGIDDGAMRFARAVTPSVR